MRDDIFNDCLEHWNKSDGFTPFWKELAKKYGYKSNERIRTDFKHERIRRGIFEKVPPPEYGEPVENSTYQEGNDFINIVYANTPLKTKEDVIREYNIDMTKWEIDFFEVKPSQAYRKDRKVSWVVRDGKVVSGDVDDSGKLLIAQLYNLRIKFIPVSLPKLTIDSISEYYKTHEFVTSIKFPKFVSSNNRILDINTGDWHIGARWYDKNWSDLEEIFPNMMSDIFNRIASDKVGFTKIYFNLMGDVFHYQNRKQQTERHGTPVEGNGMNPLEMFDLASSLCIGAIDELLKFAPVEMLYIPGNHDGDSLYHLISRMQSHYHTVETFSTDLEHGSRKARVFGRNLRGWEHGEMVLKNRVHWLQNDFRKLWGDSEYAESFSGHLHHEEVIEHGGVKTRRLPHVSPKDFWHHRNGYNGSIRATMSFVWEDGRLGWSDIWQSTGI